MANNLYVFKYQLKGQNDITPAKYFIFAKSKQKAEQLFKKSFRTEKITYTIITYIKETKTKK